MTKNTSLNRDLLIQSLSKFYGNIKYIEIIKPIIEGESSLSLRLLDWFVTNFCKKTSVDIKTSDGVEINIYIDYKSQLKAFSKQNFDPFKRRNRIKYYYTSDKFILTTVGQLNFFRWVIQKNVLNYVMENLDIIEKNMKKAEPQTVRKKVTILNNVQISHEPRKISFK